MAEQERKNAQRERRRAEQEQSNAERERQAREDLLARLRKHGIDPDRLPKLGSDDPKR